mgnify:CR=1 FL=1
MKLFHISHTDLDGYGCQLITNEYFKNSFFYNANYGLEVKLSIKKALEQIAQFKEDNILLLITDLNLTFQESKDLDSDINKLIQEGYKIKLQLLDHHISGKKSAEVFSWYFLDDKRCATKIVYDYIFEEYEGFDGDTKVTDMLYGCYDLAEAGKDFDMLVIPGAGHGYGSADKYFEKKMYRFFAKHLLGDTRADYWGDINRNK